MILINEDALLDLIADKGVDRLVDFITTPKEKRQIDNAVDATTSDLSKSQEAIEFIRYLDKNHIDHKDKVTKDSKSILISIDTSKIPDKLINDFITVDAQGR